MLRWLLQKLFHLLYQPFAWSYDLVAWIVSLGRWKRWVHSALNYLPGPRVLELGHGPGHLQVSLHKLGVHTIGLDRSPQMSRIAARRLRALGLPLSLVNGFANGLPCGEHCFDQVVATFPSEYILEKETLSEVQRVLRPSGALVVLPVAWITGSSLLERAAAWLFRVTGQAAEWDRRFTRPLARAGFQIEEQRLELDGSLVLLLICHKAAQ